MDAGTLLSQLFVDARWVTFTQVGIASVGVILALIGNISSDPEHLVVFLW